MKKLYVGFILVIICALPFDALSQQRRRGRGVQRQVAASATGQVEPVRTLPGRMMGNKISVRMSSDQIGIDFVTTGAPLHKDVDAKITPHAFDYTITKAQVVDGRLQLQGSIGGAGKAGPARDIPATLVGTLARARNPWPSANDSSARRRAAATATATAGQPTTQAQGGEARNPEAASALGQLAQTAQSTQTQAPTPTSPQGRRPEAAGEVTEQNQTLFTEVDSGSGCEVMYLKLQLPPSIAAAARANQSVQLGVVLAPTDNEWGEQLNNHMCRIMRALNGKQDDKSLQASVAQLNQMLAGGK